MAASSASDRPLSGKLVPPARFEEARFESYRAKTGGQKHALQAARTFVERIRQPPSPLDRLRRWAGGLLPLQAPAPPRGLYLVGPAGTGKTHLMAATYHHLTPEVRCAFLHSSQFFRAPGHPERLAASLAADGVRALMLDEIELDDAANEARLAHFLRALHEQGVALMATSNARPDEFLSRHMAGGGRHRRFLDDALAGRCQLVFVEGKDLRRSADTKRRGRIYVGSAEAARAALRRAFERDKHRALWLTFDELRHASTEEPHERLMRRLLAPECLYVADVDLGGTDDALRLLRIIDDLYVAPKAPALFFSAKGAPEEWFTTDSGNGLAGGIAEKFARTVSRLRELCEVCPAERALASRPTTSPQP